MKLKYTFEAVDMGDEIIFVPVGDKASEVHGVLKLSKKKTYLKCEHRRYMFT